MIIHSVVIVSLARKFLAAGVVLVLATSVSASTDVLDHLNLGEAGSERAHGLTSEGSEIPPTPKPPATNTYITAVIRPIPFPGI